jgi:hypothetical protein
MGRSMGTHRRAGYARYMRERFRSHQGLHPHLGHQAARRGAGDAPYCTTL